MKFQEFASRLHILGYEKWCKQQNIDTVEEKMATLNIYGWLCAGMNEQEVKEEIERRTCPDCGSQMIETPGDVIEEKRCRLITEARLVCLSDTCADWQEFDGSPQHDIVDGEEHLQEVDDIIKM